MHAPLEYYTWDDISGATSYWVDLLIAARHWDLDGGDATEIFSKPGNSLLYLHSEELFRTDDPMQQYFLRSLLECYLLANFMVKFEPEMCDIDGSILRTSLPIYVHADRLDWCLWKWGWREAPEFHRYYCFFEEGRFEAADLFARFCSLNTTTGKITLKNNTGSLLAAAMHNETMDNDAWSSSVSPYVGRALCWNPKSLPKTLSEVLAAIGFEEEAEWAARAEASTFSSHERRQANTLQLVLSCVLEAFPDGKQGATWQEVEARTGYSRRHILRALKMSNAPKDWLSVK